MSKLEAIGHYRIVRKLGEGGMGVVYAAEDERLGRTVAIKMIHEETGDPLARERLWREARSAARVNHPNICQIYDVGEEQGEPYLVMELLEGEPLSGRIRQGPLALGEATPVALGILTALTALHSGGVLHRDLKPSNVFLTPHGVKLLDFGLARLARATAAMSASVTVAAGDRSLTMPGAVVGTPRYMSPEQLLGKEIDERTDVFAAGAILFEMLAGRPAFGGTTPIEVYHAVLYEQPPALTGTAAIAAVNRIIFRAVSKRAADRYEAAEKMAADLRAVLLAPDAGAEVSARPMTRLIVLPFKLLKPDTEIDYLSSSLADAISCSLSGLGSLLVRSSLTASRYAGPDLDLKRIATEAEVDAVLTGTLLRSGENLRVSTQLVEAPSGTLLWSNTSQLPLREMFSLEESLTQQVVQSLSLPVSDREQKMLRRDTSASPSGYEFYLRGCQQGYAPEHWLVARDLFQRSVDEDPRYAPAWARLARSHWLVGKFIEDFEENRTRAEAALKRALEINPELPMAHTLYANIEIHSGRSIEALQRLLVRARSQWNEPDLFAGLVTACRFCGLLDASVAAHEQARRLDPKAATSLRYTYLMLGDYQRALDESSGDVPQAESWFLLRAGRDDEALRNLDKVQQDAVMNRNIARAWTAGMRALLEGKRSTELADADWFLTKFPDPEIAFLTSACFARLGESERALFALRQAVTMGFFCFPALVRDPWLDSLRAAPEFRDILLEAETHHRSAVAAFLNEGGDRLLGVSMGH